MTRRALLFVTMLLAAVLLVTPAQASPTGVSYTYAPTQPAAGHAVTLSGTANCDTPTCRWQWRIYGSGYSRLGTPIGEGPSIVTSFRAGTWLVSLKVTNSNGTNGYATFDQYIRVAWVNGAWGADDHGVWVVWTDHEGWGGYDMVFSTEAKARAYMSNPTGYPSGLHCTYTPFGMAAALAVEQQRTD